MMELCVGIDIGNAKTEIAYEENGVIKFERQPSVITIHTSRPNPNDSEEKEIMRSLFSNLTATIVSDGINSSRVFSVGDASLNSGKNKRNMTLDVGNKSKNEIPLVMSLEMLAGLGLKKHYNEKNKLPKSLTLNVKMATAIPSSEYSADPHNAKRLEQRFLGEHIVKMIVGNATVVINVNITHCKVTEEGRTAMLAFINSPNDILKHYNETYDLNASTSDFDEALSMHIDIGDGTSEIVVTEGVNPVPNGSIGIRAGVGHAVEEALIEYKKEMGDSVGEIKRQQFMKTLDSKAGKGQIAKEKLADATITQTSILIDHIRNSYSKLTNSQADFFFVHGGGSITFKEDLYDELIELAEESRSRVVWIPEEFATQMNSKGTFYLAQILFCNNDEN